MKNLKKSILLCIFSITFLSMFLTPKIHAQEWTYDGVDTEHIPYFSLYPSEWYMYHQSMLPPENLSVVEITLGTISDPGPGPGYCVWGNSYYKNITSGTLYLIANSTLVAYWNKSIGFFGSPFAIPVETDGKVSYNTLSNASFYWEMLVFSTITFENNQIYPNLYSIAFWNDTYNNAYFHVNYTDDGIISAYTSYNLPIGNLTLYSQPAQLPPVFSFAPEHSGLIVNSTTFTLNIDITSADNNNDGVADTDYSMRHFQDSTWSSWGTPPSQLLWNLGPGAAPGNYTITIEIKNMYGTTQEQIEIQYEPPKNGESPIPGYSAILISIATLLGVSFLILKNRLKE